MLRQLDGRRIGSTRETQCRTIHIHAPGYGLAYRYVCTRSIVVVPMPLCPSRTARYHRHLSTCFKFHSLAFRQKLRRYMRWVTIKYYCAIILTLIWINYNKVCSCYLFQFLFFSSLSGFRPWGIFRCTSIPQNWIRFGSNFISCLFQVFMIVGGWGS